MGAGDEILSFPEKKFSKLSGKTIFYGNVFIGKYEYKSGLNFKIKLGNTFHHQALLVNKSFCKHGPFNSTLKVYGDYEVNLRLYKEGYSFKHLENFVSFAMPDGLSSKINLKELLSIIRIYFGLWWAIAAFFYHIYQSLRYGYKLSFK